MFTSREHLATPAKHFKKITAAIAFLGLSLSAASYADTYTIDTKGSHASINFAIGHLGYSVLTGRFDTFSGEFNYDAAKPENNSVKVTIDIKSVDTNHAERDGHLRGEKFLNADAFAQATFVSKKIIPGADKNQFDIVGDLSLKGVTKSITIKAKKIGEGADPWGGYRAGFEGSVELSLADFKVAVIGPASATVKLALYVEGIKK